MVAARLSAILLIALAATLSAQTPPTNQVAITITDPTGAVIPGARVSIIQLPDAIPPDNDGRTYAHRESAKVTGFSDSVGEATFSLAPGSYAIAITAPAFKPDERRIDVSDNSHQPSTMTFALQVGISGPVVEVQGPEIPLEAEFPDFSIPLQPLPTIRPTSTRVRKHRS
jgi:hypothetical protein